MVTAWQKQQRRHHHQIALHHATTMKTGAMSKLAQGTAQHPVHHVDYLEYLDDDVKQVVQNLRNRHAQQQQQQGDNTEDRQDPSNQPSQADPTRPASTTQAQGEARQPPEPEKQAKLSFLSLTMHFLFGGACCGPAQAEVVSDDDEDEVFFRELDRADTHTVVPQSRESDIERILTPAESCLVNHPDNAGKSLDEIRASMPLQETYVLTPTAMPNNVPMRGGADDVSALSISTLSQMMDGAGSASSPTHRHGIVFDDEDDDDSELSPRPVDPLRY